MNVTDTSYYRRTDAEVLALVQSFQETIQDSIALQTRISYFWPSPEFLDRVLYAIAAEIPKAKNPLWELDRREELLPRNDRSTTQEEGSPKKSAGHRNIDDRIAREVKETKPICVEWIGPTNAQNGYAAVKLYLPATGEPWLTWTNRVIAFLFADIPGFKSPEDFVRVLKPPAGGPFKMLCNNPKCVRLAHISFAEGHSGKDLSPTGVVLKADETPHQIHHRQQQSLSSEHEKRKGGRSVWSPGFDDTMS